MRAVTGQVLVFVFEGLLERCLSVRRRVHISVAPIAMMLKRTITVQDILMLLTKFGFSPSAHQHLL